MNMCSSFLMARIYFSPQALQTKPVSTLAVAKKVCLIIDDRQDQGEKALMCGEPKVSRKVKSTQQDLKVPEKVPKSTY